MQFGGDDQWSNILGERISSALVVSSKAFAVTTPLLVGSDGKNLEKQLVMQYGLMQIIFTL